MKRKTSKKLLICLTAAILLFVMNVTAFAANYKIDDSAKVFTEDEIYKLEEQIKDTVSDTETDIIILTSKDTKGKTSEVFCNEYLDNNGYGLDTGNSVILFLINIQASEVYTVGRGEKAAFFSAEDAEEDINLLNAVYSSDYYAQMVESFLQKLQGHYNAYTLGIYTWDITEPSGLGYAESTKEEMSPTTKFLISLAVAVVISGFFCLSVVAKYRMKVGGYKYPFREKASVEVTVRSDVLVSKDIKEQRLKN